MSNNVQNLSRLFGLLLNDQKDLKDNTREGVDRVLAAYGTLSVVSELHNSGSEIGKWPELVGFVQSVKQFVEEQRGDPGSILTPQQAEAMASAALELKQNLGSERPWFPPAAYVQVFSAAHI